MCIWTSERRTLVEIIFFGAKTGFSIFSVIIILMMNMIMIFLSSVPWTLWKKKNVSSNKKMKKVKKHNFFFYSKAAKLWSNTYGTNSWKSDLKNILQYGSKVVGLQSQDDIRQGSLKNKLATIKAILKK